MSKIEQAFALAKERYAELGVDVEAALDRVSKDERETEESVGDASVEVLSKGSRSI